MGIALTDDHRELAEVARGFLSSQKARAAARSLLDAPEESLPPFWQGLAELGWLGLHIDEEHGGSGYGLPELVVVIDELGRAVAPGPFVPTVIASAVIAKDGTAEQKSRLLPGLIDGTVTAGIGLDGQVGLNDGVADGEAGLVFGAGLGDLLLIAAGDSGLGVGRGRAGVAGGGATCGWWIATVPVWRWRCRRTWIRPGVPDGCSCRTSASAATIFCRALG